MSSHALPFVPMEQRPAVLRERVVNAATDHTLWGYGGGRSSGGNPNHPVASESSGGSSFAEDCGAESLHPRPVHSFATPSPVCLGGIFTSPAVVDDTHCWWQEAEAAQSAGPSAVPSEQQREAEMRDNIAAAAALGARAAAVVKRNRRGKTDRLRCKALARFVKEQVRSVQAHDAPDSQPKQSYPKKPLPIPRELAGQIRAVAQETPRGQQNPGGWTTKELCAMLTSRYKLCPDWARKLGFDSPGAVFKLFLWIEGSVVRRRSRHKNRKNKTGQAALWGTPRPLAACQDVPLEPLACAAAQDAVIRVDIMREPESPRTVSSPLSMQRSAVFHSSI